MSWLLAVCIPGLLMVSTMALQRLESALHGDRPSTAQVLTRLEQAARSARERAARNSLTEFPVREARIETDRRVIGDEPGLPTKPQPKVLVTSVRTIRAVRPAPNPPFHTSGIANRV